jgi:hypothetical protein
MLLLSIISKQITLRSGGNLKRLNCGENQLCLALPHSLQWIERVFVNDPLEKVVGRIGEHRHVRRFTLPSGAPVYIVAEKVIGIARALPNQHHRKSRSIIIAREGQQQVQETRQAVRDAIGK